MELYFLLVLNFSQRSDIMKLFVGFLTARQIQNITGLYHFHTIPNYIHNNLILYNKAFDKVF